MFPRNVPEDSNPKLSAGFMQVYLQLKIEKTGYLTDSLIMTETYFLNDQKQPSLEAGRHWAGALLARETQAR